MHYALKDSWLGLRNSTTRLPFRYGAATLRRCPQAILEVTIEVNGRLHRGWSGDCLPPGWFDKTPGKSYRDQIDDMLGSIRRAQLAFKELASKPVSFFSAWKDADQDVREDARRRGETPLLAGFGVSLVERAIIDALCRAARLSFAQVVRSELFGIAPGSLFPELSGLQPRDWLPNRPLQEVFVRHTVGLLDPLTAQDIDPDDRVGDGLPQSLETYLEQTGIRYLKVKLSADPDRDHDRLIALARLLERYPGATYRLTLDGNEQFKNVEELRALIDRLRVDARLSIVLENVLAIEQPLERSIALDGTDTEGIRSLSNWRPVIIDESDETTDAYLRAIAVGYRGVSSKNCKGPIKAILNAGMTWIRNDRGRSTHLLMTGEDLCSVGVVPVQADLCLAATLGLGHVERNGHHYHPGLSYLPESVRKQAMASHPDFYAEQHGIIGPIVRDGRFEIGSLQCVGFGFSVVPDRLNYEPADSWSYDSLDLDS